MTTIATLSIDIGKRSFHVIRPDPFCPRKLEYTQDV